MSFNKANLAQLRASLRIKMDEIESELGVSLQVGSMRYDSNNVKIALTGITASEEGGNAAEDAFEAVADRYGLSGFYGYQVDLPGKGRAEIVAIHTKRHKYPVEVASIDNPGSHWIVSLTQLREMGVVTKLRGA